MMLAGIVPEVRFRSVGARCQCCNAHGEQIWILPIGTPLRDVPCWKCGHRSLVVDDSVKFKTSIKLNPSEVVL